MNSYRTIRVLPPHLQNQIAAGEVVERPSSVVKELVENSLDAGADRVQVQLEGGGLELILVQDNGRGMDPAEMRLALTRHATSKITAVEDLESIATFGFRGEALPSIASVSRLRMTSKSQDAPDAHFLEVGYGEASGEGPAAMTQGTRIEVRGLFGNVPARLKFMKSLPTEVRRCQEVIERMALGRLDAGFKFSVGERTALRFVPGQNLLARLGVVWPPAVTQALTPVEGEMHGLRVTGFAGLPHVGQARPDRMLFYVNGRPVQDRVLLRAVREAYKGRMLAREYPVAALFLQAGPGEVDVNVHPAKTEVRFRDEGLAFTLVRTVVARALDLGAPSAAMRGVLDHQSPSVREGLAEAPAAPKYATYRDYLTEVAGAAREAHGQERPAQPQSGADQPAPSPRAPAFGVSGGGVSADWLASRPGMEGFDPADTPAYLRRAPEGFSRAQEEAQPPRVQRYQQPPALHDSSGSQAQSYGDHPAQGGQEDGWRPHRARPGEGPASGAQGRAASRGRGVGGVEYLGQVAGTYLVLRLAGEGLALLDQHAAHERVLFERMRAAHTRGQSQPLAIPFEMSLHLAEQKKLTALWGELSALGFQMESVRPGLTAVRGVPPLLSAGEAKEFLKEALSGQAGGMEDLWAIMSCKGAVKAGDALADDEALALIAEWSAVPGRDYCPHGRPVVVTWEKKELEKLFKRRK